MKRIIIICFMVLYLMSFIFNVYASDNFDTDFSQKNDTLNEKLITIMGGIIRIVKIVAIGIAIIMLIVLGIKYLTESPNGRADIKKSLMQYAIGAGILFTGAGVLEIIQSFVESIK